MAKFSIEPKIEILSEQQGPIIYCNSCNLDFADSIEFENHNLETHVKYKNVCPLCAKVFTRQDHLKRHMHTVHSLEKFTTCPVCFKEYLEPDLLAGHLNECHPPDKKYHCRMCEFVADSLNNLEAHEVCHIPDKHACGECSAVFKRRDHLRRHYKTRHTLESVSCAVCDQSFKRRDHMLRHMRERHRVGAKIKLVNIDK